MVHNCGFGCPCQCDHCGSQRVETAERMLALAERHSVSDEADMLTIAAQRDRAQAALARAGDTLDRVRDAKRHLFARLIASAHLLDVPFSNAPDQSPWTKIKADMTALDGALADATRSSEAGNLGHTAEADHG